MSYNPSRLTFTEADLPFDPRSLHAKTDRNTHRLDFEKQIPEHLINATPSARPSIISQKPQRVLRKISEPSMKVPDVPQVPITPRTPPHDKSFFGSVEQTPIVTKAQPISNKQSPYSNHVAATPQTITAQTQQRPTQQRRTSFILSQQPRRPQPSTIEKKKDIDNNPHHSTKTISNIEPKATSNIEPKSISNIEPKAISNIEPKTPYMVKSIPTAEQPKTPYQNPIDTTAVPSTELRAPVPMTPSVYDANSHGGNVSGDPTKMRGRVTIQAPPQRKSVIQAQPQRPTATTSKQTQTPALARLPLEGVAHTPASVSKVARSSTASVHQTPASAAKPKLPIRAESSTKSLGSTSKQPSTQKTQTKPQLPSKRAAVDQNNLEDLHIKYTRLLQICYANSFARYYFEKQENLAQQVLYSKFKNIQNLQDGIVELQIEAEKIQFFEELQHILEKQSECMKDITEFNQFLDNHRQLSERVQDNAHRLPIFGITPMDKTQSKEFEATLIKANQTLQQILPQLSPEQVVQVSNILSQLSSVISQEIHELTKSKELLKSHFSKQAHAQSLLISKIKQ